MKKSLRIAVVVILLAVTLMVIMVAARFRGPPEGQGAGSPDSEASSANPFDLRLELPGDVPPVDTLASERLITKFCSTCHVLPPADCEPRALWGEKIQEMFDYAGWSQVWPAAEMPTVQEATAYWASRAPEHLELHPETTGSPPSPLPFERREIRLPGIPGAPAVSNVSFVRLGDDRPTQLLVSDMRHGVVVLWTPSQSEEPAKVIGHVPHPTRTHVVDLDGDGILDILVANLGVFWNVDTDQGSVVWLRGLGNDEFETHVLVDGISRVNDLRAADFDGDGDLDIVVGVFGNYTTGMILYLENFTEDYSEPDFEPISIDGNTGTSDIHLTDLDGDGRPDFIALQSQQHERVVAFLNAGRGRFNREVIYEAPHPRWGSTGIKLVDLDGDGDVDILLNHGDAIQVPPVLRPYHGFGWLENEGRFPFTYHRLAYLPGAHTAQPADLDGDGSLEIVSSAFIPAYDPAWPKARQLETVIWLKQTEPLQYQRYVLETGTARYPCMDLGDWDDDGDVDIVLGNFVLFDRPEDEAAPAIIVLENQSQHSGGK
jgi:hypothetical protein